MKVKARFYEDDETYDAIYIWIHICAYDACTCMHVYIQTYIYR